MCFTSSRGKEFRNLFGALTDRVRRTVRRRNSDATGVALASRRQVGGRGGREGAEAGLWLRHSPTPLLQSSLHFSIITPTYMMLGEEGEKKGGKHLELAELLS